MNFSNLRVSRLCAALVLVGCVHFAGSTVAQEIAKAVNISTRMRVEAGDNVLIGGFIVTGAGEKTVAVRALGPSLPVEGALSNPVLELFDASGSIVATNDNWRSDQQDAITAAGLAPRSDLDAALIAKLNAGSYTAVVRGAGDSTGVALVEIYDLDAPDAVTRLGNISTRGRVLTGDDVMIGGFILRGDSAKRMIMRVRGPTLSLNGTPLADRLQDPTLELFDGNGERLVENNNWRDSQEGEIAASSIPPTDDREPAVVATLMPGNYTAVVRGREESVGIGLIEMYDLDQPPQADGSTLYLAQLRAQNGVVSNGSGTSTLRVSADGKSAILSFSFSNLSSPVTSIHIHGPAEPGQSGGILFDLDDAMPQPDGTYIWVFAPTGANSIEQILAAIRSGRVYFNIHTSSNPSGEISGHYNLSRGAQTAPVPTPPPALADGPPTATDAARLLSQATFGPNEESISRLQAEGFDAFFNEQFNAPITTHLSHFDASEVSPRTLEQANIAWWTRVITAPDQLRQRVAFALSEIFVVSALGGGLGGVPDSIPAYFDLLLHGSFGNFRDLLEDVTLSPAMGRYLDMLHNAKANPRLGTIPNENYAREILQLFSIGLYRLNLDGSLTLDSQGFPIATYDQEVVLGLSATFTGWYFNQPPPTRWTDVLRNYRQPMMSVPAFHETAAKQILDGVTIPAGQTPEEDLRLALDTIFNHPNVGPFISRLLIQRLVTSNPSPGYVYRVASVFNNNGQGVRGDLRAVVRAILMDYDARGAVKTGQSDGHLREPVLRLTHLLRAFHAVAPGGSFHVTAANQLGQVPMQAPTVFNFFTPDYSAPGAISEAGLKSPEFEITTETTVITIANFLRNGIYAFLGPNAGRITLNLSAEQTMASDPARLVAHLDRVLMASSMSPEMRAVLVNAVTQIPESNPLERVRAAIYLVVNSPEYVVDR